MRKLLALLILFSCSAFAQFTSTAKHIFNGPSLPSTCSPLNGDIFFIESGVSLGPYYCSATNTWSAITGSSVSAAFSGLTGGTNTSAAMIVGAGASLSFTSTGTINASTINGATLGTTTATSTNLLIGSGTAWVTRTVTGDVTISNTGVTAIGATKVTNAMLAGSIDLTSKVTGALSIANGGTGQATQQAGFDALAPTATVAGSIIYWNGTHWVKVDGNSSGTQCLGENSSGVPTWTTCSGGSSSPGGSDTQLQYNNSGSFGGAAGYTITGSGQNLTAGASAVVDFSGASSVSLPAPWVATNATNTFTVKQTFTPTASTWPQKNVCTTLPNALDGGGFGCSTGGLFLHDDGSDFYTHVTVKGSGTTAATTPSAGLATFAGSVFNVTSTATGTGVLTFLTTPSSANLRSALTDESGTGLAYFQGGDLGTPSAGVLTNATGLPTTGLVNAAVTAVKMVNSGVFTGDVTTTFPAITVAKVNGIAYSSTAAAHSVEVITTANTTATAKVLPDCTDTGGNHLNFTQSTDAFSCGTSGSGGGATLLGATGDYFTPGLSMPFDAFHAVGQMWPNNNGTANAVAVRRVFIPGAWTPGSLTFRVQAAGSAGCRMSVGIYDSTKALIVYTGVITDATTVECDSTGVKKITSGTSPAGTGFGTLYAAGWYWIATTTNESSGTLLIMSGADGEDDYTAVINDTTALFGIAAEAATNGALPSSFTTVTGETSQIPFIKLAF